MGCAKEIHYPDCKSSGTEGYASSVFAKSVIEWQFSSNASLSGFNPELFEDKIKKFNEDASEFRKLSGQLLINHLTTRLNRRMHVYPSAYELSPDHQYIRVRHQL